MLRLINLARWQKRTILISIDLCLMMLALWSALSLRLSVLYTPSDANHLILLCFAPLIGMLVFSYSGVYRQITRFTGHKDTLQIVACSVLSVLIWSLVIMLSGIIGIPRSVVIMYGAFTALLVIGSREIASWCLRGMPFPMQSKNIKKKSKPVVIYGAGITGVQLAQALQKNGTYTLRGFVDDDPSLWGQRVAGLKVYAPEKVDKFIVQDKVEDIFLAIPEATWQNRRSIIRFLETKPVQVKILPALEDIASGRVEISALRPVDVCDLLGRDTIPPEPQLLKKNIYGKVVMVSGAGGSIGSEISRQVLHHSPKAIVLFEVSELALYEIEMELNELNKKVYETHALVNNSKLNVEASVGVKIIPVLGSVTDQQLVNETLHKHQVQTIYHAAAYKHVPLVERNPLCGLKNNTFGTLTLARAALKYDIERFVLISTDKAVRPTNIMGASKRLAELILQALTEQKHKTVFTMVRFGNVLNSSGSVLYKFRKQIREGGPITVTHPNITRYFMSIPEAAELVIQAGAMATGGDVFVLDMGKAVKIDDLARSLVNLHGLEIKSDVNPEGDVEIQYTGLRPGEKLYEELLIDENVAKTRHPRIMKNTEPCLSHLELASILKKLNSAIDENNLYKIKLILSSVVEGYNVPSSAHNWVEAGQTVH
ncbi:MAG: nucleoside-diphosphate sugar epimerase/dehydratase [Pseudomonadota bacterium]